MDDLISRQAAIDAVCKYCEYYYNENVIQNIKEIPSADVQPVVRCKDCTHYMPYDWMFSEVWQSKNIEDYPQNEIGCEWIDHYVKPDDYCSFGERKDGDQNVEIH